MEVKNRKLFIWLPLLAAWVFDLLFWKKVPGISFALFIFDNRHHWPDPGIQ